jgi:SPP1 family predicted phage head-tail adaptor
MRNIGRLDERISIQSRSSTENDFGEPIESFSTANTVSAQVIIKTGSEKDENNKEVAIRNIQFRIRYLSSLDETQQILYRNKTYDIEFIEDNRRFGQTIIHAKQVLT